MSFECEAPPTHLYSLHIWSLILSLLAPDVGVCARPRRQTSDTVCCLLFRHGRVKVEVVVSRKAQVRLQEAWIEVTQDDDCCRPATQERNPQEILR